MHGLFLLSIRCICKSNICAPKYLHYSTLLAGYIILSLESIFLSRFTKVFFSVNINSITFIFYFTFHTDFSELSVSYLFLDNTF